MRLIKLEEVKRLTCLSTSTIYKLISDGEFPKQVKMSRNTVVWVEQEIQDYIAKRIAERAA
nr:MAG TPA: putative transcriptional regulator [Caudoviricetes sp.]